MKNIVPLQESKIKERIKEFKERSRSLSNIEELCIMLIDTSFSMANSHEDTTKLSAVKLALHELLTTRHRVYYGLVSFSGSSNVLSPPTNLYGNLRAKIESLTPESTTEMDLGINTAKEQFFDFPKCKRRIILLSDGQPTCPKENVIEEAKDCKKQEIIIDTIGFGDQCDEELLKLTSEITGGVYQKATSKKMLIQSFKELKYELRYLEHK